MSYRSRVLAGLTSAPRNAELMARRAEVLWPYEGDAPIMGVPVRYVAGGAVSPALLDAVKMVESGGDPNAVSPKGALGSFQLLPATAKDLGVDPLDPQQAESGARRYLEWLLERTGNLPEALAAYNGGIGRLKRVGMQGMPQESKDYVKKVLARLAKQEQGVPDSLVAKPHNVMDPVSAPSLGDDVGAQIPTQLVAGGAPSSLPSPTPIEGVPSADGGSPIQMVENLLRDPLSLAKDTA